MRLGVNSDIVVEFFVYNYVVGMVEREKGFEVVCEIFGMIKGDGVCWVDVE